MRYFCAVAEELHFGRAATRLRIAQPPLSHQVRQLERELGVKLLARTTRTVELTAAGSAYLTRARAILDAVDDAGEHARRVASGVEGSLAIGCVGSATYSLLPQLVRALRARLPLVEVSVRGEMLTPAQLSALAAGEIDLALLRPPITTLGVSVTTLRTDALLVALPTGHRLADQGPLRAVDLRGEEFIAHSGQGRSVMSGVLTAICAEGGFVPRIRHQVGETSTLITLVAAGLGVAVVPEPVSALEIAGVCYRTFEPDARGIDLVAARTVDSALVDNALDVLHDIVVDQR